jgi:hypothetical protein
MLKITVAQLNYMVGDMASDVAKMITAARATWSPSRSSR